MTEGRQTLEFVPKSWGYEKRIVNSPLYCGKILFIAKGKGFSFQRHLEKTETFYVLRGKVECVYGWSDEFNQCDNTCLSAGDVFHVPVGMSHQLFAYEDSEIIEFSTEHKDEDTIRL